jgi:hypothetical protein
MAGAATGNAPGMTGGRGPAPATQPVLAAGTPPTHRARSGSSLAPGLFIAAAGFLLLWVGYSIPAYLAWRGTPTQTLNRAYTAAVAAGFLVVGLGLAILAVLRARD